VLIADLDLSRAMEICRPGCGEPDQSSKNTIMEHHGHRLIVARHLESIKIGRSQRVSAQRVSVASIRHAAVQSATLEGVDARTQPSGGLATPGRRRLVAGLCLGTDSARWQPGR
jgi:hypothetical protein